MPYFHISNNPNIKRLMPRSIGARNGLRKEEKISPDANVPVVCAAKSIAACIALISAYQENPLAVYLCEDDGHWFQAKYDHPESELEWRRTKPCNVIFIGWVYKKGQKYHALRRCTEANRKAKTISKHETDFELDRELIFQKRFDR